MSTPTRRILFVDDEPNVLAGLRRMLRPMRGEWQMTFAGSGREALEVLAREPHDVVVTDMRMPGMDGAELLSEVRRLYPDMVRIVLTGHCERSAALRSVETAHQQLSKPCDPDQLRDAVRRACALHELLADGGLRKLVSRLSTLPSLPQVYVEIVEALKSPDTTIEQIGEIIARDVGMTAKVLQLVNSAFFGLRRHVADPTRAVSLLGIDTIKALVLSLHIFNQIDQDCVARFRLDTLWHHSVATGALAKRLATWLEAETELRDHALLAGLLHDAGKLVLAANLASEYQRAIELARKDGVPMWQAELRVLNASHAEVGAYLLGLWGLPDVVVEAVAFHHRPAECLVPDLTPLLLVHVADTLIGETSVDAGLPRPTIDATLLNDSDLPEHLDTFRRLRDEILAAGASQ